MYTKCYSYMSCVSVWFVVFFFFKQKTAYEMRISDWSSDVCSSDLASAETLYQHCVRGLQRALDRFGGRGLPLIGTGDWNDGMNRVGEEIGRASCRERVCQYV